MDTLALSGIVVMAVCLFALVALLFARNHTAGRVVSIKARRSGNEVGTITEAVHEPGQEHIELMVGWPPLITK